MCVYVVVSGSQKKYVLSSPRGFAFVVFQEEEAVQKVLDSIPHTIDGRQVDAKKAIPHAIHQVSCHVSSCCCRPNRML